MSEIEKTVELPVRLLDAPDVQRLLAEAANEIAALKAEVERLTPKPPGVVPKDEPIMKHFGFAHLPKHLQEVSRPWCELAWSLLRLPRSAERSTALRKALEGKDAAVRAAMEE